MAEKPSLTSKMKLDVCKPSNTLNVLRTCPQLKEIPAIFAYLKPNHKSHRDRVVKYIVILYSPDSPVNKTNTSISLEEKKRQAAHMAGFVPDQDGNFSVIRIQEELFKLTKLEVFEMILGLLKWYHNYEWTQLVVCESLIEEYTRKLLAHTNIDDEKKEGEAIAKKKLLREELHDTIQQSKKLWNDIFTEHEDVKKKAQRRGSLEERAHV